MFTLGVGAINGPGTQTYEVAGGTWQAGNASGFGILTFDGLSTTVDAGATLDLNDFSAQVNTLLGAGVVTTGVNAATGLFLSGTGNFSGTITGAGHVNVVSGTTILTGTNLYSGGTIIDPGATLQLGNGGATGSIIGDVLDNGTLAVNRTGVLTLAGNISGTGNLTLSGGGALVLTGTNTYSGGTTINAGTMQLGAGGTSGSILGNVVDNGVFAVNRSDVFTFGGVISGTGSFRQIGGFNGLGTTILTGANTYSGGTTIAGGTLAVGADSNLGAAAGGIAFAGPGTLQFLSSFATSRAVSLNATGTFDTQANTDTLAGVISGPGGLTKVGSGILALNAANTYTGPTTINAGTLQTGIANALSTATAVTVGSGASFNLNGFNQSIGSLAGAGNVALGAAILTTGNDGTSTTFSGAIGGSGGLTKVAAVRSRSLGQAPIAARPTSTPAF